MNKIFFLLFLATSSISAQRLVIEVDTKTSNDQYYFLKSINKIHKDIPVVDNVTNYYYKLDMILFQSEYEVGDSNFVIEPDNKKLTYDITTPLLHKYGDIYMINNDIYNTEFSENSSNNTVICKIYYNGKIIAASSK